VFAKLRELSKNITIYGLGDVAVSIVSFFLLSVYVDYLTPTDYGVFGLLGVLEVIAKIVFRFGLDGSFMRFFYDCEDEAGRRRLASTIFLFLLVLNGTVLAVLLAVSGPFAVWLLGSRTYTAALRLMLVNTFAIGFTFIPFHVLRMERRSVIFSLMTLARSVMTIVLRLLFVINVGLGVTGLYLADVVVTATLMAVLARWFAPLIRAVFSRQVLRETLAFGLPRVPHAAAQQVLAVGDKFILKLRHVSVENIGIYSMAVSFGLTQKLFLSAFEIAWAPFYYATIREPDAGRVFRTITTYAVAVLALLSAGLAAVGRETAALMTHGRLLRPLDPRWAAVDVVIVWTSVGVFFQGVYLLTSIGLNITKRTQYYPIATMTAAATNVALNFLWIPRHGMVGAAWANGAAYALQAALGYVLSQRFYRIEYEWGRLFRVCAAGIAAAVLGRLMPSLSPWGTHEFLSQLPDLLLRGALVIAAFVGLLAITGFFHAAELRRLAALRRRGGPPRAAGGSPDSTEMAGEIVATDIGVPEE
jgi:O-antigen/teichoic acid export membrane protein